MSRAQDMTTPGTRQAGSIFEVHAQRRRILELRAQDGTAAATIEIPTRVSDGATVRLRQKVWTAAELQRLVRVLTRAAEKLDG